MVRWIIIIVLASFLYVNLSAQKGAERKVTFRIIEDFITTQAMIDGESKTFILDTGSPCLVLNSRKYHGDVSADSGEGITGSVDLMVVNLKDFQWGNFRLRAAQVYALDLSHLEELLELEIAGLIGYEALEEQRLFVDYQSGRVELYSSTGAENLHPPDIIAKLYSKDNFPCIQVDIKGKTFELGIDSGSLSNFLDEKSSKELLDSQNLTDNIYLVRGLNQERKKVSSYRWDNVRINGRSIPADMEYLVICLEAHSPDNSLNGVLGVPFLKQGAFLIDFRRDELSIWLHDLVIN